MLKKALTKSGLRILKAIKKLSTKTKRSSKISSIQTATSVSKVSLGTSNSWRSTVQDHEAVSLSWSLASLDTKSVDTYLTLVSENVLDYSYIAECGTNDEKKCCCCCAEYEENQRNENRENEMFL